MSEQEPTILGFSPLAKRWGTSRDTLIRAANRGELKTIYIAGRRFIPMTEVMRVEQVGFGGRRNQHKATATVQA